MHARHLLRNVTHLGVCSLGILTACSGGSAAPTTASPSPAPAADAQAAAPDPYHPPPRDTVELSLYKAWQQYMLQCARCHGDNGQGTALAPPLWGSRSYNRGAGMARINTAASFIYALMPIDRAVTLTPQAAFDVSTYINTRPRPEFPRRAHDWPRGGRPPDADYHILPVPTKEKAP